MKRIGSIAVWIACMASLGMTRPALAQGAPDMRDIFPYLMLVIDTSGSMERLPACTCDDLACLNCLPTCNPTVGSPQKNRWATTLEALTGTFNDFKCEPLTRSVDNGATYDVGYYLPYHQPWDCTAQPAGTDCAFNATNSTRNQGGNGILDEYKGRVNFGLMTFDGWDTYVGAPRLVPVSQFDRTLSEDVQGLWSYGDPKSFHYPNCTTDYMMDTGARSSVATEGSLVSLNSCRGVPGSPTCPSWCTACWNSDPAEITNQLNEDIQEALLSTRPYGGTPIAASLDDLYHHFKNDLTDSFAGCRNRFALLMTDGEPDADYRDLGCNCKNEGTDPARCGPPPNDPDTIDYHCPYPTATEAAHALVHGRTAGETAVIERLYVIGLAVDDPRIVENLNAIAREGCTEGDACKDPVTMNEALFATDLESLVSSLGEIITKHLHPVTRSVPVFANARGGGQYQLSTGFDVPVEKDAPWQGVIERRRFGCDANDLPIALPLVDEDRLHDTVRAQVTPNLLTTLPQSGNSSDGWIYGKTSTSPCGVPSGSDPTGCALRALNHSSVDTVALGLGPSDVTTLARRAEILDWMYGAVGSRRAGKKLGDIYHASPVVSTPPQFDTVDEAYNEFRALDIVKNRPSVIYASTNDGMIRAISLENFIAPAGSTLYTTDYTAGQQLWGFVPPLLLDDLEDNLSDHRITMDGTPVLKDVYFERTRGATGATNATKYHSVLIAGMRGGGQGPTNAYVALDVTNPTNPKFLWQFSDPDDLTDGDPLDSAMGKTYAQPGIFQGTYRFDDGSGTFVVKNGAVAIIPGGMGLIGASGMANDCADGVTNPGMKTTANRPFQTRESRAAAAAANHRTQVRCWKKYGRVLYFIDVETGRMIKKLHLDASSKHVFPSPLISTPAIFPGEIGTTASHAYVTDADGVIWRINLKLDPNASFDPLPSDPANGWTVRPFHDVFWDRAPTSGEVSYEAPILSVDPDGRPVVIVGTGDTDNFNKTAVENRVVSLTEVYDGVTAGLPELERYQAAFNWEKRVGGTSGMGFVASELVTGSMALFSGQLFFPTFISVTGSDACDLGKGRVFGVDYLENDPNDVNVSTPIRVLGPKPLTDLFDASSDANGIINVTAASAAPNVLILGLGVQQRPSCQEVSTDSFDAWTNDIVSVDQLEEPAVFLTALGGGENADKLKSLSGGRLRGVEMKLKRARTTTRVLSWATSVD